MRPGPPIAPVPIGQVHECVRFSIAREELFERLERACSRRCSTRAPTASRSSARRHARLHEPQRPLRDGHRRFRRWSRARTGGTCGRRTRSTWCATRSTPRATPAAARFEAFCPTAKGEPRWWDVTVSPLRDEHGELRGLISISRDVSADVRARELRETTAAEMKHRLRNAYALTSAIVTDERARPRRASRLRARDRRAGSSNWALPRRCCSTPARSARRRSTCWCERLTAPFCSDADDARHRTAAGRHAERGPGPHAGAGAWRIQHQQQQIWRAWPWREDRDRAA